MGQIRNSGRSRAKGVSIDGSVLDTHMCRVISARVDFSLLRRTGTVRICISLQADLPDSARISF